MMRHLITLIFTLLSWIASAQGIITPPMPPTPDPDVVAGKITNTAKSVGRSVMASESINRLLSKPEEAPETEENPEPEQLVVNNADGTVSDHGYVDLGLPSGAKWARCNVGASSPNKPGEYYAWGETSAKSAYTKENAAALLTEYPADIQGLPRYDAASSTWGTAWHLPTAADVQELLNNCTFIIVQYKDAIGYLVTGPNGKSIFLPAGGWKTATSNPGNGLTTNIWTATPDEKEEGAKSLAIQKDENGNPSPQLIRSQQYLGANIRPILR